jgi:hypothetical protein
MKKIVMILAATAIFFGAGLTVEKTKDEARIPVGGGHLVASIPVGGTSEVAYIPVGGTSADTVAFVLNENMTVPSIPVGGT